MALLHIWNGVKICRTTSKLTSVCSKQKLRSFCKTTGILTKIDTDGSVDHKKVLESNKYTVIYRNPLIRIGALANILKWPQLIVTGASVPIISLLYFFDIVPGGAVFAVAYIGFSFSAIFFSIGLSFKNAIGFIYLSEDEKTVKLAYLNNKGRRVNLETPVDDILYFTELPKTSTDIFYKTVLLYSTSEKFKLSLHVCHIFDKDKFIKIFGSLK